MSDSAAVPLGQSPALAIEKTVTGVDGDTTPPFSVDAAGDVISYSILVTNTGNQTLTGVSVVGSADREPRLRPRHRRQPDHRLHARPGRDADLHRARYTVTQADIDNNGGGDGDIDNTATADSDQTGPASDSAAVPLAQSPALTIEKTVTGVDADTTAPFLVDAAGDVISLLDPGHEHGQSDADGGVGERSADRESRLRPGTCRQPDDRLHARPGRDADLHRDATR